MTLDFRNTLFEQRKLANSYALVHFHGIIDFGVNVEAKELRLRRASAEVWRGSYRVELMKFHSDKTVRSNLLNLSKYLVKGGNENLIYKIGFGWDSVEKMERQMPKSYWALTLRDSRMNCHCQWRRQIVPDGGVKVYQSG